MRLEAAQRDALDRFPKPCVDIAKTFGPQEGPGRPWRERSIDARSVNRDSNGRRLLGHSGLGLANRQLERMRRRDEPCPL